MLFFSTSCFKGLNLIETIKLYLKHHIRNIEIGSFSKYENINEKKLADMQKAYNINFLVHGYVPPLKIPIVTNLASLDENILMQSIEQAKSAIDLAEKVRSPSYSLHSGWRYDPKISDLGRSIKNISPNPHKESYNQLINSLNFLCQYANKKKIRILLENHVIIKKNLTNGKNNLLLGCEAQELISIIKKVNKENFGLLVDIAHLNVSSNTLGFDKLAFLEKTQEFTLGYHISDNDGITDQHLPIDKESEITKLLKKYYSTQKHHLVVESQFKNIKDLLNTKSFLEKL